MRARIRKCGCGRYTLKDECPECGGIAVGSKPARFSPQDRYGGYRRMMKREIENHSNQT